MKLTSKEKKDIMFTLLQMKHWIKKVDKYSCLISERLNECVESLEVLIDE